MPNITKKIVDVTEDVGEVVEICFNSHKLKK